MFSNRYENFTGLSCVCEKKNFKHTHPHVQKQKIVKKVRQGKSNGRRLKEINQSVSQSASQLASLKVFFLLLKRQQLRQRFLHPAGRLLAFVNNDFRHKDFKTFNTRTYVLTCFIHLIFINTKRLLYCCHIKRKNKEIPGLFYRYCVEQTLLIQFFFFCYLFWTTLCAIFFYLFSLLY